LICNPISGGGRSRTLGPALASALQGRGVAAEVFFTAAGGDARARAQRAGAEAWDGLVCVGGDGTVNEVLNGMPDPTRALGVLPVGTANVLAAELRLPRLPEAAAAVIAAGHRRALAIGRCEGRRFLLFCGVGLDGAVVQRLSAVRTGTLGKHKWLGPILHTVRRWPRYELSATLADGTRLPGLASVLVTRVRNYGGVLRLTPGIDAEDGRLHVLCFRQRGRLAWLWLGARAFCGLLRAGRGLEVHATTAVRIDGPAPFQIDGDFGGTSPVQIDLLPQPARLWAPPRGAR
jgi:diacylglycerol kinase family enzyme